MFQQHQCPGEKIFHGVVRVVKLGVYTSWDEAQVQVLNYSGFRVKKFKSFENSTCYVAQVQREPRTVWYVLKILGEMAHTNLRRWLNRSNVCAGSTLVEKSSLSAVKRFLGKSRLQVYRRDY